MGIAIEVIKAMGKYSKPEEVDIYEGVKGTEGNERLPDKLMSPEDRQKYAVTEAEGSKKGPSRRFTGEYNAIANNCINFASSWITQVAATNPDPAAAHWVITEVLRQKVLNTADDMEATAFDTSVAVVDKTVAVVDTTVVTVERTTSRAKKMATTAVTKAKGAADDAVTAAVTKADNVAAALAKSTATAALVLKEVSETLKKIIKDPSKMQEPFSF